MVNYTMHGINTSMNTTEDCFFGTVKIGEMAFLQETGVRIPASVPDQYSQHCADQYQTYSSPPDFTFDLVGLL